MNATPPSPIRIAIADDHAVVRAGLRSFLGRQKDMVVVAEASTGEELVECARATAANIALTDLRMPGSDVPAAIAELVRSVPPIRVLVFSAFDEPADALDAFRAGATGYVLKQSPETEVLEAIRRIHVGGRHVDGHVASRVLEDSPYPGLDGPPGSALSEQERRVLDLVARGYTGPEIALELGVRVGTVESYRHRIRKKLGLKSRAEVTLFVRTFGHRLNRR